MAVSSAQTPTIRIVVLEGQGAINDIRSRTTWDPAVQVLDEQDRPVRGATVTFGLPEMGASALFADGSRTAIVVTGENGRASVAGLKPNAVPGRFEIRVLASYQGRTARASIPQVNVASSGSERSSRKLVILGLIAAGAAGGLVAASSGSSSRAATPAAAPSSAADPIPIPVVPGTPGFGPPR